MFLHALYAIYSDFYLTYCFSLVTANLCGLLKTLLLVHIKSKAPSSLSCLLHQWCKFSKHQIKAVKYKRRWPRWHFFGPPHVHQGTMPAGLSRCSELLRYLSPGPCSLMCSQGWWSLLATAVKTSRFVGLRQFCGRLDRFPLAFCFFRGITSSCLACLRLSANDEQHTYTD